MEDREAWYITAMAHAALLKRLSCAVDEGSNALVSLMANLDQMKELIGIRLYNAVQASRIRVGEGPLTRALPLYLARASDLDFVLEIWMCSSHGRAIAEEMRAMTSVEDWELILGEYLYMAMKTSRTRILEEDAGQMCTKAAMIFAPNGDNYDSKLVVKMNFNKGRDLLTKCYP
jgi:hypothetical protein